MKATAYIASAFLASLAVLGFSPRFASAMTISPPDFNLSTSPGDVIRDVLHVYNEDPYPVTLKPTLLNFTFHSGDETSGAPEFYAANETRNGHELAEWVQLENDEAFTIGSGERVNIPFTLTIPKNAQPGGHFGAIHLGTMQETPSGDGAQIAVNAKASTLLFVRVSGDVREDLAIESFFSQKRVYARLPAEFTIRVSNEGTTHLIPVGNIFLTNAFGRQVASLEVNGSEKRRVLPGGIRRFEASWLRTHLPKGAPEYVQQWKNFAFGRYTATLALNYGTADAQKLVTATTDFWVLPWMAFATVLVFVAAAFLAVRQLLKSYERRVISRYESKKGKSLS